MAAEITVPTERYVDWFSDLEKRHAEQVDGVKRSVLIDESLPDLDRAVLGLLGSAERLEFYQMLAGKVKEFVGHPAILISETRTVNEDGLIVVDKACGGIIAGEVTVDMGCPLSGNKKPENIDSAHIKIPVKPAGSYARYSERFGPDKESIYMNEDSGVYDRRTETGLLEAAHIGKVYRGPKDILDNWPMRERQPHALYIGREEIYASPYFQAGVSKLLQAIEEF